jgi:hypothetical protein
MSYHQFSLASRHSGLSLFLRLLPPIPRACVQSTCAVAVAIWSFAVHGGLVDLLRSPKKVCNVSYIALHLVLSFQPPQFVPDVVLKRIAEEQA